jgi:hypothetical protein
MTRSRRVLLAVAAALALVACDGDDGPDGTTTAGTVAPTSTSTSTPGTTTSPPDTTPSTPASANTAPGSTDPATTDTPPVTDTPTSPPIGEQDWAAILEALSARQVALYATPDLSRIGEYCWPGSDCELNLEAQLGDAIARGEHIEGQHPFDVVEILSAAVGEPTEVGTTVIVDVVVGPTTPPPARIVDAAGNVVDELSLTTTNTRGRAILLSWPADPELPWRVVTIESQGPVP